MKKLYLLCFALASFSALATDPVKSIPKGVVRQGTISSAIYEFNKIEYREHDGFKPRKDKKVFVTLSGITQKRNSAYSNNVGQSGAENLGGPATDIKTSLNIVINDGVQSYSCLLSSSMLSDGFDSIGYDQEELKCDKEFNNGKGRMIIRLIDNSENRVEGIQPYYELILKLYEDRGIFRTNRDIYFEAQINAK